MIIQVQQRHVFIFSLLLSLSLLSQEPLSLGFRFPQLLPQCFNFFPIRLQQGLVIEFAQYILPDGFLWYFLGPGSKFECIVRFLNV